MVKPMVGDFEEMEPLLEPVQGQGEQGRRTIKVLIGSGLLLLVLTPLALISGAPGLAGFLALMAVVTLGTALLLQRGMDRNPWQQSEETGAGSPRAHTLGPPHAEPHMNLPIGPGRVGAEAAEELLHEHDEDNA